MGARTSGAPFIDLNTLASDRYDALGEQKTAAYFSDNQHTLKIGARVNAESLAKSVKRLGGASPLAKYLLDVR